MAERAARTWTAADFLAADQHGFGSAWRYELVDGLIVAPGTRLRGNPDHCRPEIGSGAAPRRQQRATARIPDVTVRCGALPRVVFEVVSPSELCGWRARDRKRRALQDVEGVREIVEIYEFALPGARAWEPLPISPGMSGCAFPFFRVRSIAVVSITAAGMAVRSVSP